MPPHEKQLTQYKESELTASTSSSLGSEPRWLYFPDEEYVGEVFWIYLPALRADVGVSSKLFQDIRSSNLPRVAATGKIPIPPNHYAMLSISVDSLAWTADGKEIVYEESFAFLHNCDPSNSVIAVSLSSTDEDGEYLGDIDSSNLKYFENLRWLEICGMDYSKSNLRALSSIKNLEEVTLSYWDHWDHAIDFSDLASLKDVPKLRYLSVMSTHLDGVYSNSLEMLELLRYPNVDHGDTNVFSEYKDSDLKCLSSSFPNLKVLTTNWSCITPRGLRYLSKIKTLREVRVYLHNHGNAEYATSKDIELFESQLDSIDSHWRGILSPNVNLIWMGGK